jgi:hypothetical protein
MGGNFNQKKSPHNQAALQPLYLTDSAAGNNVPETLYPQHLECTDSIRPTSATRLINVGWQRTPLERFEQMPFYLVTLLAIPSTDVKTHQALNSTVLASVTPNEEKMMEKGHKFQCCTLPNSA